MAGEKIPAPAPVYVEAVTLAKPGGHYSHACSGAGMVFIAGQLPITPQGERLVNAAFAAQAAQVLENVKQALLAAGSGVDRLLQVRVYVDDIANWPAFDTLYREWAGASRPARAVVPTGPLHFGFQVEMEAGAIK